MGTHRERKRKIEGRRDRVKMKMDSPAVYTKPGGAEYKHPVAGMG